MYNLEPPSPPVGPLTARLESSGAALLEWQPSELDGGAPIRFYLVERLDVTGAGGLRSASVSDQWLQAGEVRPSERQLRVEGLRAGREYLFRVSAVNVRGASDALESDRPLRVTAPLGRVPLPPQGPLNVTELSPGSVAVSWRPSDSTLVHVDGYVIELAERESAPVEAKAISSTRWRHMGRCVPHPTNTRFMIRNLLVSRQYVLRVRAFNDEGLSEPLVSGPVTLGGHCERPFAPFLVRCIGTGSEFATIEWKVPPCACGNEHIDGYVLYWREASDASLETMADVSRWTRVCITDHYIQRATIAGLQEGLAYYFAVAAFNRHGSSDLVWTPEPTLIERIAGIACSE